MKEHFSRIKDLSNEKHDHKDEDVVGKGYVGNEDLQHGNTNRFNGEVINLNLIVENVFKSVVLVDGFEGNVNDIQEGISFIQLMCNLTVEKFLNDLDRANENLVECATN
uniref:Uncharacterized protein n=1 Tax=Lactuca sativa TaxID=4236 RepID=A0A9R1WKR6_LACSA|nr:hypothetical protein LSAT_V11C100035680 [Lactuca sativa]